MFIKDTYDLFAETDAHLTRPKFKTKRHQHLYPSEASVVAHDEHGDRVVHGGCMRASYFRLSGEHEGTPHDARSEFIFLQGNTCERFLVGLWKEMGIWVANSVKFVDKENNISGELDAILSEPPSGQLYGVEVKTFYGYFAESEIMGTKRKAGFPKMNHLLQTLIYLNHFEDRLPYFRIVYFARDSVKRRTFKVELHREEGKTYPKVDGNVIKSFTMEDVLARYKELQQCVNTGVVPPNDFELQYDDAKVRDFHKKGKVGKTKFAKWETGKLGPHERIGDWMCSYCSYKNVCWE